MNREQFLEYVDHFNNKRYDAVISYFAPDLLMEFYSNWKDPMSPPRTLRGRQEFIDSYKFLHEHVREVIELGDFLESENMFAAELYTEFHCFKDHPTFSRPLKKGDVLAMTNWAIYNVEDGKIKRIRITHFRMHDPKDARY